MDVGGHLRLWLMRYRSKLIPDILWQPSTVLLGNLPGPSELWGLDATTRLRLGRLIGSLYQLRQGDRVPLAVRALAQASLYGATGRALSLIEIWVAGARMPLRLMMKCIRLQRAMAHRVRNVLQEERSLQLPNGTIELMLVDVPAPIIPFAVALYRQMLGAHLLRVYSGGDRLYPGVWIWEVDTRGEGEVIRRERAGEWPLLSECRHRDAFEPASGGSA
jgi:hypothetical protein